ncbi:gas vesicle protein [Streptomyces sp. NPDC019443]|uniref:gas vesicle protein n=1 Tax=Streptomyces sp. NPDC019443 TaxID=3365061 RepID=UPI0037B0F42D
MSQGSGWSAPSRRGDPSLVPARPEPANLADILERVLDKGIVIAGDIRINLLDIELLTIKIRLLVASVDRAREMGIDWWEHDPTLSSGQRDVIEENRRLRRRIGELEAGDGDSGAVEAEEEADRSEHEGKQR